MFQKYGVTVDVDYAQGNTGLAAMSSGEAQMNMSDGVTAIEGRVAGQPLKVIAVFDKISPYMLAAQADINSPADLGRSPGSRDMPRISTPAASAGASGHTARRSGGG